MSQINYRQLSANYRWLLAEPKISCRLIPTSYFCLTTETFKLQIGFQSITVGFRQNLKEQQLDFNQLPSALDKT